jgi:hypothetical protein
LELQFRKDKTIWLRLLAVLNTGLAFIDIVFAQVRQGLLAGGIGIIIVLISLVLPEKQNICLPFKFCNSYGRNTCRTWNAK